ncbi:MAG: EAL domain-containing protein [Gammaproteobacteria bacterium]|nr:EAL domain-containing protein [Gammaproteobacteria bacterium]
MAVDIHHSPDISEEQLDLLCKSLVPSMITSLVTGIIVSSFAFIQQSNLDSFIWLMTLFVVSISRYYYVRKYMDSGDKAAAWRAINIGAFASGATWGLAPFIMFVGDPFVYKMFLVYILAGVSAGALAGYSASVVSYLCFVSPVVLLSSFNLALSDDDLTGAMSLLSLIYLGLLALTSIRMQQYIRGVLSLNQTRAGLEAANSTQSGSIEQLNNSLENARTYIDMAKLLTWETDADLNISSLSRRFQQITGEHIDNVLGRNCGELTTSTQNGPRQLRELNEKLKNQSALVDYEVDLVRQDGVEITVALNGEPQYDSSGVFTGYRGTGRDITAHKKTIRKLEFHATHDSLTGLVNRRDFYSRLDKLLDNANAQEGHFYLVYMDLDRLKIVNDTVGHLAGDELLKKLAGELQGAVAEDVRLSRIGGDEFGFILENTSMESAIDIVECLIDKVRAFRFEWEGQKFSVGVFVGLVPVLDRARTVTELVRYADHACFVAREKSDSGYYIANVASKKSDFSEKDTRSVQHMFDALDNGRFTLNYQPIKSIPAGGIDYFEVLLNLQESSGNTSSTGRHISAVEKFGAMAHFDRWVIHDVLRDYEKFHRLFPDAGLFVNVSGSNLDDEALYDFIREQMAKYAVPREKICFEITETAAVRNLPDAVRLIHSLKSSGCRFALDDFGTGLASLNYLKEFPVDFVKMDGSFIRGLKDNPVDQAMLRAVVDLGKVMGFQIIAESVEDPALISYLAKAGVDYAQGYAIGYPLPLAQLSETPVSNESARIFSIK